MGLYEQVDYNFSGPLQLQDLFGREYVTMGGVIDHHLTTTVQSPLKMPKKPVVTTNNGLFLVLGRNCAEPTKFTFQRQSIPPCRSSPTLGAGGSNPFRLFSLLYRAKSEKSMTDFPGAFYRDVQPF